MNASAPLAFRVLVVGVLASATAALAEGEPPLHQRINERLQAVATASLGRCSDAEFLRRASLDLIGMPPTADEARQFLADPSPEKRAALVDRLLASPHHARHIASQLDVMLMERRPNTNVAAVDWNAWLLKAVQENRPWNVMARESLLADGDPPLPRAAARFNLDRASEGNLLARDVGRIFFGMDLQCAQCHDHPLVDDYLQSDYQGMLAYFAPAYPVTRKEGDKEVTVHAEKAGSDIPFESVFIKGTKHRTGPRMPDAITLEEPFLFPGEEYDVAPAEKVKSVPKFSRRTKLAELATSGSNRAFNENIVNRLWAMMMGRGLVHPLDLHHPANPATDPELLRLLADHFARSNFDIKRLLRELALTETYQRPLDLSGDVAALASDASTQLSTLEGQRPALEQAAKASADAYASAMTAWHQSEAQSLPVLSALDAARTTYADARKKYDEASKALSDVQAQLQTKRDLSTLLEQAASAAKSAALKLPDDKELADAAGKFAARSQQFATEVANLTKGVEEKTAAMAPHAEGLAKVKPPVEAALAAATPLRASLRTAEQAMLDARRKSASDAHALAALDRRLATVKKIAGLPAFEQAIASARQLVQEREAQVAAAQKGFDDHVAVMAQKESALQAASSSQEGAKKALEAARSEHAQQVEKAQAIQAAFESAETALEKSPGDAILIEVASKLKNRAGVAQTQTSNARQQVDQRVAEEKTVAEALAAALAARDLAVAERTRLDGAIKAAQSAVAAAQADVQKSKSARDAELAGLTDRWAGEFALASLKPLTPEQLCWTVFRVTGVYASYWGTEAAELDKTKPLTDDQKKDPARIAARNVEIEQRTYDKLKGNVDLFVAFYGAAPGQPQGDFFATADQALFAANGGGINHWVVASNDNVTHRIIKQADPKLAAEELYLAILTRMPTAEESDDVVRYLANRTADKPVAAQELVWALLNSVEFRFNH